ncbi:VOC family protein [Gilvimarinus sp. F26214L]|uniref:VOC family protein n=1 Tax=Gilvimarinus sp. DZF01 TaxID=3461371 RepID=UPI004045BA02
MSESVEELLAEYENGHISRRSFLASLSAMALMSSAGVRAQTNAQLEVTSINHVTLFVKDIPKAAAFYQDLFGLEVKSQQSNGINLSTGDQGQFLGFYGGTPDTEEAIHHVCLGVKNFDVDRTVEILSQHGIKAQIRMRDEVPEIYFLDPNGIFMQLQDESYCGGSGPLGSVCKS